jgi:hypothetical protein
MPEIYHESEPAATVPAHPENGQVSEPLVIDGMVLEDAMSLKGCSRRDEVRQVLVQGQWPVAFSQSFKRM